VRSYLKNNYSKNGVWGMAQVVKYLSSNCGALSSSSGTERKWGGGGGKREGKGEGRGRDGRGEEGKGEKEKGRNHTYIFQRTAYWGKKYLLGLS
jgi:hypothetical protein